MVQRAASRQPTQPNCRSRRRPCCDPGEYAACNRCLPRIPNQCCLATRMTHLRSRGLHQSPAASVVLLPLKGTRERPVNSRVPYWPSTASAVMLPHVSTVYGLAGAGVASGALASSQQLLASRCSEQASERRSKPPAPSRQQQEQQAAGSSREGSWLYYR